MIPIIVAFFPETLCLFRHLARYGASALMLLGCATPLRLEPILRFDMDGSPRAKVAFNRGTDRVAGAAVNGKVYLWRVPDGRAEDGCSLMGSEWFKLFQWDIDSGALTVLPTDHGGLLTSLDSLPGSRALASIGRHTDGSVRLLDPRTGETVRYVATHDLCSAQVRVSPGARYLASVSDDASVWVFALE